MLPSTARVCAHPFFRSTSYFHAPFLPPKSPAKPALVADLRDPARGLDFVLDGLDFPLAGLASRLVGLVLETSDAAAPPAAPGAAFAAAPPAPIEEVSTGGPWSPIWGGPDEDIAGRVTTVGFLL